MLETVNEIVISYYDIPNMNSMITEVSVSDF